MLVPWCGAAGPSAGRRHGLALSDPSFSYVPESSDALGFGFRCGFLGLLHLEIVKERLEPESDLALVQTLPNVSYEVVPAAGEVYRIDSPSKMPDPNLMREVREPVVLLSLMVFAFYNDIARVIHGWG